MTSPAIPSAIPPAIPAASRLRLAAGLRLIVAGFCWLTAAYAFAAASPFAYRQFLAPRVFPSIGLFSDWHGVLYWIWLAMAVLGLWDVLRRRGPARLPAIGFVASGVGAGVYLVLHPVLPSLADDRGSLVVGLIALLPVLWLALIDYLDVWATAAGRVRRIDDSAGVDEGRLFVAAIGTAVLLTLVDATLTPLAMAGQFEPDLLTRGLLAGLAWNLIDQLIICCGAFVLIALVQRLSAPLPFGGRYATALLALMLLLSQVARRTVFTALGFGGGWLTAAALALSASIAFTWGALRLLRWTRGQADIASPFELLLGPSVGSSPGSSAELPPGLMPGVQRLLPFLALAAAAWAVAALSRLVDWDFLVLTCGVFALWLAAFDQIFRLPPRDVRIGGITMALACLAPLSVYAAASTSAGQVLIPRHALDRYAVYNSSFRVADRLLRNFTTDATVAGDDRFHAFLRANTGLGRDAGFSPAAVTFSPLDAPAPPPPPHIFLFVIDSLRRDYLQPYNASVSFTPNLARFGRDSLVFRNAFTAYGGTGLSVPAIWSGSMGVHMQYLTPFAPMNALEHLLDRHGYRQFLTFDSLVRQLIPRTPAMTELDAGLRNEDVTFCRTVGELQARLEAKLEPGADSRPVFAYSLPQDLHISNLIGASVPAGESYPGFHPPYAARVRRIDACFGGFVDFLKRRGWYDRSVIVVTADHGEMLGEEGLWGHVYYLFPPVVEIPLIVHLPRDFSSDLPSNLLSDGTRRTPPDLDAVSLTTDITPTIYAALGYTPERATPLMGRSLVGPGDTGPEGSAQDHFVLTASYSAVYGMLRSWNCRGCQLYIVDAVQHREYAYERRYGSPWRAVPVTAGLREVGRRVMREHIYDINRVYRVKPRR